MSKKRFTLRTPDAPASYKQKISVCALGGGPFEVLSDWTMQQASDFIDIHGSDRNLGPFPETPISSPKATPMPIRKPLNDDIIVDIAMYISNSSISVTPNDIVKMFHADGHRVDITTVNNTLNKVATDPSHPMYPEFKLWIASKKLVRNPQTRTPKWESFHNPTNGALVVVKEIHLDPAPATGLAMDNFEARRTELMNKLVNKPGNKKLAMELDSLHKLGAIATTQQVNLGFEALSKQMAEIASRLPPPKED